MSSGHFSAASSKIMQSLSSKLDICVPVIQGKVVYVDYPVYGNVGDLLIWMGARALFERNNINLIASFSTHIAGRARYKIAQCDTICCQGGGNFGDLYGVHQELREQLIRDYPHKRIVFMPQSIHFENEEKLKKTCKVLKSHKNLHIFLRDEPSFALLKRHGVPNIVLCPDTAHALWGTLKPSKPVKPQGELYLLRKDKEKSVLPKQLAGSAMNPFDWEDLLVGAERMAFKSAVKFNKIDKWAQNLLPSQAVWNWEAKRLIRQSVNLFSKHEAVVTNRLHAMILGLLLGKDITVYDNSYGKLSRYASLWFKGIDGLQFVDRKKVSKK